MLRLGLDSYSLHRTLDALEPYSAVRVFLKKVKELKLDGWQFDPRHLDGWNKDLVREIGAISRGEGLYLELGSGGFEHDHLIGRLEMAAQAGARSLRTFVAPERIAVGAERVREIAGFAVPHLTRLAAAACDLGVPVAVENHEDLTSEELQQMLEAIGSDCVGACLDAANALSVGEDPAECARRLAPCTIACHLKDWSVRVQDGRLERTTRPFGSGDARLDEVFNLLRETRPELPITVEQPYIDPRDPGAPDNEDAAVRQAVEYVRGLESGQP
ncbi:MAG: sugar phosphate isomerase/epimerase [Armatimonadetes bacterium]|nr:sugar phosphate isomerase/epimerase [Armatimonadota bacterium]